VAGTAQPSAADVIAAGMKYGPTAGLAIQRSQYLADALARMQADTANIRTPTALWSSLLADGITQWGKNKADKEAMTAYSTDRAAQARADLDALGPSDVPVPAVPPTHAAPSPAPAGAPVPPAAVASAPVQIGGAPTSPPPAASNSPTPDQIKLAQMVWGEARGEPPEGQQAVAAVALNRAAKGYGGAKSLADVLEAPHQFEGLTPKARAQTPDKLAAILANIQPELNGADPTGGAINFLSPTLQAQLGRSQPAWARGPSQTIGHQAFYGGNPQLAQAAPPHPPLMGGNPQAPRPDGSPQIQPASAADLGAMGMGAQPFPPAPPPPAPVTPQAGAPPAAPPASPGAPAAGGAAPRATAGRRSSADGGSDAATGASGRADRPCGHAAGARADPAPAERPAHLRSGARAVA
jgi:spore germination cell wall hydrolase CwlJ-like protein